MERLDFAPVMTVLRRNIPDENFANQAFFGDRCLWIWVEVFYNAKDPIAEICTHDTKLKKCMRKYAEEYQKLCRLTDDDGQSGLRFEIDKSRISIHQTAPYSGNCRRAASELAKKREIHHQ